MSDITDCLKRSIGSSLYDLLRKIPGEKDVIFEANLIPTIEYFALASNMKECGVLKFRKLEAEPVVCSVNRYVYIVRSSIQTTKLIADQIMEIRQTNDSSFFWVIFIPRKLSVCAKVLESEGVYGYVEIIDFPLGLVPIDTDMMSLELPDFYSSCIMDGNQTDIYTAALSLIQVQQLFGPISRIHAQGNYSNMVIDLMKALTVGTEDEKSEPSDAITDLILFDRDIDYVPVLLTSLTYEAMLWETFNIKYGRLVLESDGSAEKPIKIVLNNNDPIYKQIRSCHLTDVLNILKSESNFVKLGMIPSSLSVEDMARVIKHRVRCSQQFQRLPHYMDTCEAIVKQRSEENIHKVLTVEHAILHGENLKECLQFIEDLIHWKASFFVTVRLLCLFCIVQDGVSSKDYDSLLKQFLQTYGHKYLTMFQALKTTQLFYPKPPVVAKMSTTSTTARKIVGKVASAVTMMQKQSAFTIVSKEMKLVNCNESTQDDGTKDMSYVFNGKYVPLSGRLTEQIIDKGCNVLEYIKKYVPGQVGQYGYQEIGNESPSKRRVLVYFIGGVTFAETAALKLLSKQKGFEVIIATTGLINGNTLIETIMSKGCI